MRKLQQVILGIGLTSLSAVGFGSCHELNDLWAKKFHSDFNIRWQKTSFSCPSSDSKVAKAIYDVYKPDLSFDFYHWAADLVETTYYDANCPRGVVATMRSDGVMKICSAFYSDSEASRAGTIVHEAAHAQAKDPGHVVCVRGSSKGSRACDKTLYGGLNGSGYNHEFVYYTRLIQETSYNELGRDLVRHTIKYMLNNRFNEVSKEQYTKWANI